MAEERVQRRLAAILAADVVGYSRLMGEDEAGTRARFNAHLNELIEPAIANRQGRIVKTTGDGLLVGHCLRKILNIRGGRGTVWINPE